MILAGLTDHKKRLPLFVTKKMEKWDLECAAKYVQPS